jgi:uridine kinase
MKNNIMIIGISGASASGKSLLANTIVSELGSEHVVVISEDSYYKDLSGMPFEERKKNNYDHPDALDHGLLYHHLLDLQKGKNIDVPVYDYALHQRSNKTKTVGQHRIIVLEGILLFVEQKLRELMDIRIFMDTPLDICLIRRLIRDTVERERSLDSVLTQYQDTVRPMYLQFIEPSKRYADIIVPRGGENRIAIDMIQAKMRELLQHNTI